MKRIVYILVAMSIAPQLLQAQPDTLWTRTYGGYHNDGGAQVIRNDDGSFTIVGFTYSYGSGLGDVYLIKVDSLGDTLWTNAYGGEADDFGYAVATTSDGGYILVGSTHSFGEGDNDVYLIRTDAHGDTLWTRSYGGSDEDGGTSVIQLPDNGYYVAGASLSLSSGREAIYLVRADPNGDTLWTKTIEVPSLEGVGTIASTSDGGWIVPGYTEPNGAGGYDVFLMKIDLDGDTLWTRSYGGTHDDWANRATQTADGGYIVVGGTKSYGAGGVDAYLIRTDANGDTLWTRAYGGTSDDSGLSSLQTSDGGYLVVGGSESYGAGYNDVYVLRIDSDGDTLWIQTYGGADDDAGGSIAETSDGGYIIAGLTFSYGAGWMDAYLIRIGPEESGIEDGGECTASRPLARIYPNPSSGTSWFAYVTRRPGIVSITLYDVSGREIHQVYKGEREAGEHRIVIDTSSLASGIYFLRLDTPGGSSCQRLATLR
jgi:hypothetical protein